MLRVILFSLAALVVLMFVSRQFGVTPGEIEDRLLLSELNAEDGLAYLQKNAQRPGVVQFPEGLQVEVVRMGEGDIPLPEDWVRVHYLGEHIDGRVFEDTFRRDEAAVFPVEKTIPGWQMVLTQMPVGTRARVVIPPKLAYGARGGGVIGPEETLVFELELLAIVEPPKPVERTPDQHPVPGLHRN